MNDQQMLWLALLLGATVPVCADFLTEWMISCRPVATAARNPQAGANPQANR